MEKFVEENIERDIKNFELTDDLYNRYLIYCENYNLKPLSRRGFAFKLGNEKIGAKYRAQNKPARWGVKLLPCKY